MIRDHFSIWHPIFVPLHVACRVMLIANDVNRSTSLGIATLLVEIAPCVKGCGFTLWCEQYLGNRKQMNAK